MIYNGYSLAEQLHIRPKMYRSNFAHEQTIAKSFQRVFLFNLSIALLSLGNHKRAI